MCKDRYCKACNILLDEKTSYWYSSRGRTYLKTKCRKCLSEESAKYNKVHKEHIRIWAKENRRVRGIGVHHPCEVCGNKVKRKGGGPIVCSLKCRLLFNIKTRGTCWLWTGYRNREGYGRISSREGPKSAHRVSYEIFKGPIPEGSLVCHSCDHPWCVNPAHLWVGTNQDNMTDMIKKGRQGKLYGEESSNSKLSEKQVHKILDLLEKGIRRSVIAKKFKVCKSTIDLIKQGRSWKHITCPEAEEPLK